jgi:hypothetical protein
VITTKTSLSAEDVFFLSEDENIADTIFFSSAEQP